MGQGRAAAAVCLLSAFLASTGAAHATVRIAIDLSSQRMHVQSAEGDYDWPISSARSGFYTPGGSFAPTHLELMHYSRKYHMSPMPHAIFFRGGYAIHGTYATGSLGRPASHGCVRLSPGHATLLYDMVKAEGARISISGTPPASPRPVYARRDAEVYADWEGEQSPRRSRRAIGYAYAQPYGAYGVYAARPYGADPYGGYGYGYGYGVQTPALPFETE